jgi:hypothetical protein
VQFPKDSVSKVSVDRYCMVLSHCDFQSVRLIIKIICFCMIGAVLSYGQEITPGHIAGSCLLVYNTLRRAVSCPVKEYFW